MKKRIYILVFFLLFSLPLMVSASTTTYPRDSEHLQVWEDIELTESRKWAILNTPKVDEKEKVYDFADLFTPEEEQKIYSSIVPYVEKYQMDFAVVTISQNNKSSVEAYADDFYDYNYFGVGKHHDGVLFLVDMDNRTFYLSTTGKAILVYDDERINKISDSIYDYFSKELYGNGVLQLLDVSSYYASLGVAESNQDVYIDEDGNFKEKKHANFLLSGIGALVVSFVVSYSFISRHKGIELKSEANDYLQREKTKMKEPVDKFLTTYTARVPIASGYSNTGGSGRSGGMGGSIGGSSIHIGSSGTSHGGGGRRF